MYDTTTKRVQQCSLETLKYFASFCEANSIRYFIAGGTLLGAVRHNGFIPWDDDIDIAVPRKDYDKLILLRDKIAYPYLLRNALFDSEMKSMFSKLENVATTKVVDLENGCEYVGGLSIDIFPQDGVPEFSPLRYLHLKLFDIVLGRVVYPCMTKNTYRKHKRVKMLEKLSSLYSYDHSKYVRSYYGVYGDRETYEKALFGKGTQLLFEGVYFNAPEKWDKYLTQMYGDYMQLPPKEKQCTSHRYKLVDTEKPYKDYLKDLKTNKSLL